MWEKEVNKIEGKRAEDEFLRTANIYQTARERGAQGNRKSSQENLKTKLEGSCIKEGVARSVKPSMVK